MLKILIATLVLIALGYKASTQPEQLNSVSFGIGPAAPTGNFASTDWKARPGFAQTGYNIELNYRHALKHLKPLGYIAKVRYQQNPLNTDFTNLYSVKHVSYEASYSSISILVGATASIKLIRKAFLECHALVGNSIASSPELHVWLEGAVSETTVKSQSSNDFGYILGGGIHYNINKILLVSVCVDYQASEHKFPSLSNPVYMTNFNVLASLGYRF